MKLRLCIGGLGFAAVVFAGVARGDFSYSRYAPGDLDAILAQQRAGPVVPLASPARMAFDVTLLAMPERCDAGVLAAAAPGMDQGTVSRCITVKTAKGATATLFAQDNVAEDLSAFPPGTKLTLYADQLLRAPGASGLLVKECITRSR